MKFEMNELREMLDRGPMTFIFRKKDDSVRRMTATTNSNWIPENQSIEQRSDKFITVYDMEKKGFRSISVDTFVCA